MIPARSDRNMEWQINSKKTKILTEGQRIKTTYTVQVCRMHSFTGILSSKCGKKWSSNIPPNLKRIATLICEILVSDFRIIIFTRQCSDAFEVWCLMITFYKVLPSVSVKEFWKPDNRQNLTGLEHSVHWLLLFTCYSTSFFFFLSSVRWQVLWSMTISSAARSYLQIILMMKLWQTLTGFFTDHPVGTKCCTCRPIMLLVTIEKITANFLKK